jgi:hypothetical protein
MSSGGYSAILACVSSREVFYVLGFGLTRLIDEVRMGVIAMQEYEGWALTD